MSAGEGEVECCDVEIQFRVLSERDERVLALVRERPRYCVEVASELGLKHWTAKSALERLRMGGFVSSWLRPSPNKAGPGRRYYGVGEPPAPAGEL